MDNVVSVAEYAEDETIAAVVRNSDGIRAKALALVCALDGYETMTTKERNAKYDEIVRAITRDNRNMSKQQYRDLRNHLQRIACTLDIRSTEYRNINRRIALIWRKL